MSFANDFKRNQQGIKEEIAYYRSYAGLDGMGEFITVLEELRDKWKEHEVRYEGRGKTPTEPFDWNEDRQIRSASKESMNKIIKAAAPAGDDEPQEIRQEDGPL